MTVFGIHRIETSWKINLDQTAGILKNNSYFKLLALIWHIEKNPQ